MKKINYTINCGHCLESFEVKQALGLGRGYYPKRFSCPECGHVNFE